MKYCEWTYEESAYAYETSCGFLEETIKENKYVFCPYCGKKIKENKK